MNALNDQLEVRESILIDGKEVGWTMTCPDMPQDYHYHAIIPIDTGRGAPGTDGRLAQGFGSTREDAIDDAFAQGREFVMEFLGKLALVQSKYMQAKVESMVQVEAP